MNRKLLVLNVALLAVIVFAGVKWHDEYQAEKAREAALHNVRIKPAPALPFHPLANDPPVLAMGYKDVAVKTLFHPSRDPNEPVEVPAPPPPPPPPPPMPELPRFHGQMNLGDGPMALLAEKSGMPEKAIKPGESIGQFKLVDVNTSEITFQWSWNGELVRRSLGQLIDRTAAAAPEASRPANSAQAAPPAAPVVKSNLGAGEATQYGYKQCLPNDSSPVGTIDQGYRKVSVPGPFGSSCRWDPVGR